MTTMVRRCPVDGQFPINDDQHYCPICLIRPFEYHCQRCKQWSKVNRCSACERLTLFEARLVHYRERGDVDNAVATAREIVNSFPGKSEYRHIHTSLERARDALAECMAACQRSLTTAKQVARASKSLADAGAALRVASFPDHLLAPFADYIKECEEQLSNLERIRRQMVMAVAHGLMAALFVGSAWALGHLMGLAVAMAAEPTRGHSAYLWTRGGVCAAASVLLVPLIACASWGIPRYLVGLMTLASFEMALLTTTVFEGYWTGLFIMLIVTAVITWIFESGLGVDREQRGQLHDKLQAEIASRSQRMLQLSFGAAILAFLVAPCLAPPGLKQRTASAVEIDRSPSAGQSFPTTRVTPPSHWIPPSSATSAPAIPQPHSDHGAPRYVVTGLLRQNGKLAAVVMDHQSDSDLVVSTGDMLGADRIMRIDLPAGMLIAQTPSGEIVKYEIPVELVHRLRSQSAFSRTAEFESGGAPAAP